MKLPAVSFWGIQSIIRDHTRNLGWSGPQAGSSQAKGSALLMASWSRGWQGVVILQAQPCSTFFPLTTEVIRVKL